MRIHAFTHYKGDLQKIGNEAFELWLKAHEPQAEISIDPTLAQEHKAMADLDQKVRDAVG